MKDLIGKEVRIGDKDGEITRVLGTTHLEVAFFNLNDGKTSVDIRDIDKFIRTNKRCPKCGNYLYPSDVDGYEYVCYECDENFYECETKGLNMYRVFNENCLDTMKKIYESGNKVDLILTSPPYNTSRNVNTEKEISEHKSKYKDFNDCMPNEEYRSFMVDVVNHYDNILKENGVVLLNLNYASSIEIDSRCSDMIKLLYEIVDKTNFDIADIIVWKKKSALPNNRSANKLTRIVEYIFVLCRKDEYMTFKSNKKMTSFVEKKNLMYFENVFNFVEAKNNDGNNDLNKATYSTELCEKLLNVYAQPNSIIYDSFNGTGTTGVAALKLGHSYIGSEISKEQCEFTIERLKNTLEELKEIVNN